MLSETKTTRVYGAAACDSRTDLTGGITAKLTQATVISDFNGPLRTQTHDADNSIPLFLR